MKITIILNTEDSENPSTELAEILRGIAEDWAPTPPENVPYWEKIGHAYALTEGSTWYNHEGKRVAGKLSAGACVELRRV